MISILILAEYAPGDYDGLYGIQFNLLSSSSRSAVDPADRPHSASTLNVQSGERGYLCRVATRPLDCRSRPLLPHGSGSAALVISLGCTNGMVDE
ncbi:hypothetical protein N7510_005091 [Penicillium lagena]|uniref:uncharacterized protein n=1 Tax=Penicillium lagena TaxID=94218 RepID=UPI00254248FB|nr:uncharacterized protein N7510_005091 [Penicillium lagena]KAJ5621107.1 hypothetical protein N7510_005091 [Penicillium lagena]